MYYKYEEYFYPFKRQTLERTDTYMSIVFGILLKIVDKLCLIFEKYVYMNFVIFIFDYNYYFSIDMKGNVF